MEVGGDSSVTAVDVAEHPVVAPLAAGRGELTGLALWLMAERRQVSASCPVSCGSMREWIRLTLTMLSQPFACPADSKDVLNPTRRLVH